MSAAIRTAAATFYHAIRVCVCVMTLHACIVSCVPGDPSDAPSGHASVKPLMSIQRHDRWYDGKSIIPRGMASHFGDRYPMTDTLALRARGHGHQEGPWAVTRSVITSKDYNADDFIISKNSPSREKTPRSASTLQGESPDKHGRARAQNADGGDTKAVGIQPSLSLVRNLESEMGELQQSDLRWWHESHESTGKRSRANTHSGAKVRYDPGMNGMPSVLREKTSDLPKGGGNVDELTRTNDLGKERRVLKTDQGLDGTNRRRGGQQMVWRRTRRSNIDPSADISAVSMTPEMDTARSPANGMIDSPVDPSRPAAMSGQLDPQATPSEQAHYGNSSALSSDLAGVAGEGEMSTEPGNKINDDSGYDENNKVTVGTYGDSTMGSLDGAMEAGDNYGMEPDPVTPVVGVNSQSDKGKTPSLVESESTREVVGGGNSESPGPVTPGPATRDNLRNGDESIEHIADMTTTERATEETDILTTRQSDTTVLETPGIETSTEAQTPDASSTRDDEHTTESPTTSPDTATTQSASVDEIPVGIPGESKLVDSLTTTVTSDPADTTQDPAPFSETTTETTEEPTALPYDAKLFIVPGDVTADIVPDEITTLIVPDVTPAVTSVDVTTTIGSDDVTTAIGSDDVTTTTGSDNITTTIGADDVTTTTGSDDITTTVISYEDTTTIGSDDVTTTIVPDVITNTISDDDVTTAIVPDVITNTISDDDVTTAIVPEDVTADAVSDGDTPEHLPSIDIAFNATDSTPFGESTTPADGIITSTPLTTASTPATTTTSPKTTTPSVITMDSLVTSIPAEATTFDPDYETDSTDEYYTSVPNQITSASTDPTSLSNTSHDPTSDPDPPKRALDWASAKSAWKYAWEIHIYTFGALFGLLALYTVVCVLRLSCVQRMLPRGYFLAVNIAMFLMCASRSFYMLYDGYNSGETLHVSLEYFLYSITFPCLTSAFSLVLFSLLRSTNLAVMRPAIQNILVLSFIIVLHFVLSIATDVLISVYPWLEILKFVGQVYFIVWGLALFLGYAFIFRGLYSNTVKRQKNAAYGLAGDGWIHTSKILTKFTFSTAVKILFFVAICGLVAVGLEVYAVVDVYKTFSDDSPRPWAWWLYHTVLRVFEFLMALSLCYVASLPFTYRRKEDGASCGVLCSPCAAVFCCGGDEVKPDASYRSSGFVDWHDSGHGYPGSKVSHFPRDNGYSLSRMDNKRLLKESIDSTPVVRRSPVAGSASSLLIIDNGVVRFQTEDDVADVINGYESDGSDRKRGHDDSHNMNTFQLREGYVNPYSLEEIEGSPCDGARDKSRKSSVTSSEFFRAPSSVSLADSMENELEKAFESFKQDPGDETDGQRRLYDAMVSDENTGGDGRGVMEPPRGADGRNANFSFNDERGSLGDYEQTEPQGSPADASTPLIQHSVTDSPSWHPSQADTDSIHSNDLGDGFPTRSRRRPSEGQGYQAAFLTSLLKSRETGSKENIDV